MIKNLLLILSPFPAIVTIWLVFFIAHLMEMGLQREMHWYDIPTVITMIIAVLISIVVSHGVADYAEQIGDRIKYSKLR